MSPEPGVLATFERPADAARAIRALREHGVHDVRTAMPAPYPEVLTAAGGPRSPMAFVSLPGAVLGIGAGLALTIGTSLAWRLVTGGRPAFSAPPFVVISFELSILVGALATLVALVVGGFRGGGERAFPRGLAFCGQRIGVYAAGADRGRIAEILRAAGAEEVRDVP